LEQAHKLIYSGKDPSEAAYILVNLGNLYIDQKQYNAALSVFQEALAMRKKTGDEASIARTIRNIAQVQMQIGNTDKARDNLTQSLRISQKLNDGKAIADTYNELVIWSVRLEIIRLQPNTSKVQLKFTTNRPTSMGSFMSEENRRTAN